MLQDPFYAGFFFGKDDDGKIVRWEVNKTLPRIITEKQHRKIISMMKRKGNPRPFIYTRDFPYKRFMECGHCGGSITAERKIQMICDCKHKFSVLSNNNCPKCQKSVESMKRKKKLVYVYYHCCKKSNPDCPAKSIRESVVDEQLVSEHLRDLAISPSLKDWMMDNMKKFEQKEKGTEKVIDESWNMKLKNLQVESDRLLDTHIKGYINEEEFSKKKEALQGQIEALQVKMGLREGEKIDLKELDKKFDILVEFEDLIRNGEYEEKLEGLSTLGSNLTVIEKKLSITRPILYQVIAKGLMKAKQENEWFEPSKYVVPKEQNTSFEVLRPVLLRRQDSNLQPID